MLTIKSKSTQARYDSLLAEWSDCERCPLSEHRRNVVFCRGTSLPAQILYLGEAPGKDEDAQGQPFVGQSGKVLNGIIARLPKHTYAIANVVGCIPWKEPLKRLDPFSSSEVRPPSPEEIEACSPRTHRLAEFTRADGIVYLGKVSAAFKLSASYITPWHIEVVHPAYLERKGYKAGHHEYERVVLALETFIERVLG